MWRLRMWGLKTIVCWPSKTEGVGTSHLKLTWLRGFEYSISKPRILRHHIPEHPSHASMWGGWVVVSPSFWALRCDILAKLWWNSGEILVKHVNKHEPRNPHKQTYNSAFPHVSNTDITCVRCARLWADLCDDFLTKWLLRGITCANPR